MDQPETRELRYFVTVAEELHFGRAAERLGMAQPPLSRAIRQLERRMGVTLFERTSRAVRLTPAGEVLLSEGRHVLDAMAAATRRTQRAGQDEPRLVLAMKPSGGDLTARILAEFEAQPEAVPVDIVFSVGARAAMVRDGRADVALLHRPQNDVTGLDTEDLRTLRQVVVLAEHHPLATRTAVPLADLTGEPLARWPEAVHSGGTGPLVEDVSQLLQLISLNRTIALLPWCSTTSRLPPGLVWRPVPDAPTTTVVVAWNRHSTSRTVAAFVRAATTATRAGPDRIVREPAQELT
jgi:DNA-binding transcriptional LysR family regulator